MNVSEYQKYAQNCTMIPTTTNKFCSFSLEIPNAAYSVSAIAKKNTIVATIRVSCNIRWNCFAGPTQNIVLCQYQTYAEMAKMFPRVYEMANLLMSLLPVNSVIVDKMLRV